ATGYFVECNEVRTCSCQGVERGDPADLISSIGNVSSCDGQVARNGLTLRQCQLTKWALRGGIKSSVLLSRPFSLNTGFAASFFSRCCCSLLLLKFKLLNSSSMELDGEVPQGSGAL